MSQAELQPMAAESLAAAGRAHTACLGETLTQRRRGGLKTTRRIAATQVDRGGVWGLRVGCPSQTDELSTAIKSGFAFYNTLNILV